MSSLREMESQCSWCVRSTFQCKTNITFRHRYQTSWQKYDNLQEQVRILLQKSLSNKAILGVCLCSAVVSVVQFQNTCDQAFCAFVQPLVSVKCFDSESEKTETIRWNWPYFIQIRLNEAVHHPSCKLMVSVSNIWHEHVLPYPTSMCHFGPAHCCVSYSSTPLTICSLPTTCRQQHKFVYFVPLSIWCNSVILAAFQLLSIKHTTLRWKKHFRCFLKGLLSPLYNNLKDVFLLQKMTKSDISWTLKVLYVWMTTSGIHTLSKARAAYYLKSLGKKPFFLLSFNKQLTLQMY